ncbi:hypothetical protein [Lactococcus lactis]|uniref:hypothetical protein n=1 Tax=Lactococcus lactis TaxID=1358 RepID=UPI00223BE7A4|nr:hypothetical protein [Lactococcus lactis]
MRYYARKEKILEKEVITVNVNIENIDKLKDLSAKLARQCEQVYKTIDDINHLDLEVKV